MKIEQKKTLTIGDPWPTEWRSARGLVGKPCNPVWHAIVTPPQSEAKTAKRLQNAGVEVQYPTFTNIRHIRGKKHTIERPAIPGLIYAHFRYTPQWDVMKERRVIVSVMARGKHPVELSDDDIARVMGLPTEAERVERERLAALMPRAGEQAKTRSGPLAGLFVDVERVEAGRVWWSMVSGIKGEGPVEMFERRAKTP